MLVKISLVILLLALSSSASANDAIQSSITPVATPLPIMIINGNSYAKGTYAIGTIQLYYTVNAYHFTAGQFASIQLGIRDQAGTGQSPSYPVTLNLVQKGSSNLTLTQSPDSFSVAGGGWSGQSTVTISIPPSVALDPALNTDGTDLVGNLQLETSPSGSHLNTVTTVQVHIKLVHPTNCLRMYNFITDEAFTATVTWIGVNVSNGTVRATVPYGQLSDDILVVNACGVSQPFDLKVNLDSSYETNPHGNPGNAVFTYLTTGSINPVTFNIGAFGAGTPQGESLCLESVTLPAGETFLSAVHMGIKKISASALPADGTFDFSAEAYAAGSGCTGVLSTLVTPNPATASVAVSLH